MSNSEVMWTSLLQCLFTTTHLGTIITSIIIAVGETKMVKTSDNHTYVLDKVPPMIIEPKTAKSMYIGMYDENVEVVCKAEGIPEPVITWLRDGVEVTREDVRITISNGNLILLKFYSEDNAYFQCKASNPFGTSLSQKIHIQADLLPTGINIGPQFTSKEIYEVEEGKPFALPCDNVPQTPADEFLKHWYDVKSNEIVETKRVAVDTNGTLHFAYTVTPDSQKYRCGITQRNGKNRQIVLFPKGEIAVLSARAVDMTPKLAYSTKYVKAVVGSEASLECFFSAKPVVTITWEDSKGNVINGSDSRYKLEKFGRRITIKPIKEMDEGRYVCTGTNIIGSDKGIITVNVTGPPMSTPNGELKSRMVAAEGDTRLYCKPAAAENEFLNKPMWYKNGKLLTKENLPSRYSFSRGNTELVIRDVNKEEDTANFQCNVSNSEGYLFYDSYLKIFDPIVITKQPATKIRIKYGDVVDITILAKGDDCCPIKKRWLFEEKVIEDLNKFTPFQLPMKTNTSQGKMKTIDDNKTDSDQILFDSSRPLKRDLSIFFGRYTCQVTTVYQFVPITFTIKKKVSKRYFGPVLWLIWFLVAAVVLLLVIVFVVCKSIRLATRKSRRTVEYRMSMSRALREEVPEGEEANNPDEGVFMG